MLKQRKAGRGGAGAASSSTASTTSLRANNKRYLILTYAVEFDRVHFPLPLSFEEAPNPASLQRTIARLRKARRACATATVAALIDTRLHQELQEYKRGGAPAPHAVPDEQLAAQLEALQRAHAKLRQDATRQLQEARAGNAALQRQLQEAAAAGSLLAASLPAPLQLTPARTSGRR